MALSTTTSDIRSASRTMIRATRHGFDPWNAAQPALDRSAYRRASEARSLTDQSKVLVRDRIDELSITRVDNGIGQPHAGAMRIGERLRDSEAAIGGLHHRLVRREQFHVIAFKTKPSHAQPNLRPQPGPKNVGR